MFQNPIFLAALPLIALPIIIHLINQRRYQTIRWGAMMFLLTANRMSRGYARLRQWLILLFRMLAIAGLIFAVARPLASGWLGLTAGGRADTTIILLDRSPSMKQQAPGTVLSKLETGRQKLARTLSLVGSSRYVLIESTTNSPRELASPDELTKLSAAESTSASADLPALLQSAHDYIQANKSGRTEVWICSDLRQNDWNAESGRWSGLRDAFLEFPQGVRFHLVAYSQPATSNVSVRVTNVRRLQTNDATELLVSLRLKRDEDSTAKMSVPVQFEIEGARSEVTVELAGAEFELKDHRISIERTRERGWGKVSIPADSNSADNDFYFAFDQPVVRQTLVVADDAWAARSLQLSAAISPDPSVKASAEVLASDQLSTVEWDKLALVLWHAPLPEGDVAKSVREFVDRGGQVIFFPPRETSVAELDGVRWDGWTEAKEDIPVETWRGDQDLLARTQSGAALPVGQLQVRRVCGLTGETTSLATLKNGKPLLARLATTRGGIYFCTTTSAANDSSLSSNGVVLYVLIQRALAAGAAGLGNTRQVVAGDVPKSESTSWQQLAGSPEALSDEFAFHAGAYSADAKLLAVNRAESEDHSPILANQRVDELFQGLDFARVDDNAGSYDALIQEIWRLFLAAMMIALIVEAALCLPRLVAHTANVPVFDMKPKQPAVTGEVGTAS